MEFPLQCSLGIYDSAALATDTTNNTSNNGVILLAAMLALFAVAQVGRVLCDYWLGFWSDAEEAKHNNKYLDDDGFAAVTTNAQERSSTFFIWVFGLITVLTTVLVVLRAYVFIVIAIRASNSMHRTLIRRVLRAPVNTYFDVTPTGRILNRCVSSALLPQSS